MAPSPPPNDSIGPGAILANSYEVVREIGRGAYGVVYEVRGRLPLRQRMALKVLSLDRVSTNTEATTRFMREAQVLSELKHPNLLSVFEVGAADGRAWIAMEFLEGESFATLLAREGRLAPAALVELFLPVLSALARVHARLLVHRDIKPDNLFLALEETGRVVPKLLDFGIVKTPEGSTREGLILGTPQYMSPEQWLGARTVNPKSDQFSLGVILYEALTGERLFTGTSLREVFHQAVHAPIPSLRERVPEVPEGFAAAVMRALTRDPDGRFTDVSEFARALWHYGSARTREDWAAEFGDGSVSPPMSATASARPKRTAPTPAPTIDAPPTSESTPGVRTLERRLQRSPNVVVWAAVLTVAVGFAGFVAWYFVQLGR